MGAGGDCAMGALFPKRDRILLVVQRQRWRAQPSEAGARLAGRLSLSSGSAAGLVNVVSCQGHTFSSPLPALSPGLIFFFLFPSSHRGRTRGAVGRWDLAEIEGSWCGCEVGLGGAGQN